MQIVDICNICCQVPNETPLVFDYRSCVCANLNLNRRDYMMITSVAFHYLGMVYFKSSERYIISIK